MVAADNLDRDLLVAVFHDAIFAGVILGTRSDDGGCGSRGEDVKNAREDVRLSAPAGIDGRLHDRANAPIGADCIGPRAGWSGVPNTLSATSHRFPRRSA